MDEWWDGFKLIRPFKIINHYDKDKNFKYREIKYIHNWYSEKDIKYIMIDEIKYLYKGDIYEWVETKGIGQSDAESEEFNDT